MNKMKTMHVSHTAILHVNIITQNSKGMNSQQQVETKNLLQLSS